MKLFRSMRAGAVLDEILVDPEFQAQLEQQRRQLKGFVMDDMAEKQVLGTGSFGLVKMCIHKGTNNVYAIKMISKAVVLKTKQLNHIQAEKDILACISHPFIINLYGVSQDKTYLFLALEFSQGGELFTHLRKAGRFSNDTARVYAASVVLIFEYLHDLNIIYRDLKPENLLIDSNGHLKICDFGFAKIVLPGTNTWTLCGTPEYLAPEIILNKGHGKAVDWWTCGVLIFEMLAGFPPWNSDDRMVLYKAILKGKIVWPKHLNSASKDLISQFLNSDLSRRLGNLKDGAKGIQKHAWFSGFNWKALLHGKMEGPIKIKTKGADDASNFEDYPDDLPTPGNSAEIAENDQALFNDFEMVSAAPVTPKDDAPTGPQFISPKESPKPTKSFASSLAAKFSSGSKIQI